ncbi:MAG: glycosyltransferase family 4 protein [Sedimentisphaerales bacterium]|nr:glycosyltransferase family 4 protein [Sedimentisphaerales bacterium]
MSKIHVLYSFPLRVGTAGNGMTAWHQISGLIRKGVDVHLYTASCDKPIESLASLKETLQPFGVRLPLRLFPWRAMMCHDLIVAGKLPGLKNKIDIIHCWPSGSLQTLKAAKKLRIKTVLERPSSHTRFGYQVVIDECKKQNFTMPKSHYTTFNKRNLAREESEFDLADKLLCPSEWVVKTFLDQGVDAGKIARHQYGFDGKKFGLPVNDDRDSDEIFKMVFVASGEPRKGLHYALDAWLSSDACKKGIFYICGSYIKGYREMLAEKLAHPSIKELGFNNDVGSLMRQCHAMVLPSIDEGSALVTYEARACGCVLLVSEATGARCTHMHDSLVHNVGDVDTLREHIDLLANDSSFYQKVRKNSIAGINDLTWDRASELLLSAYQRCLNGD